MKPATTAERQRDFRARMALLGMKEVRGVFLPANLHANLKKIARQLMEANKC